MKIKVLRKHIREGVQCVAWYCPVALAMKDRGLQYATVDATELCWTDKRGVRHAVKCSSKVWDFVEAFDQYGAGHVAPLEFELDPRAPSARLGEVGGER